MPMELIWSEIRKMREEMREMRILIDTLIPSYNIGIDVSGSISPEQKSKIADLIMTHFSPITQVCAFNTEVIPFTSLFDVPGTGSGGTSFDNLIEFILKDSSLKRLIVFTDGYGVFTPSDVPSDMEIVWVLMEEPNPVIPLSIEGQKNIVFIDELSKESIPWWQ